MFYTQSTSMIISRRVKASNHRNFSSTLSRFSGWKGGGGAYLCLYTFFTFACTHSLPLTGTFHREWADVCWQARQAAEASLSRCQWGPGGQLAHVCQEHHGVLPREPGHEAHWRQRRILAELRSPREGGCLCIRLSHFLFGGKCRVGEG